MTKKTVQIIPDPDNPDELLLDLGSELCAEIGWAVGDTIRWTDNKDGSWTLTKITSCEIQSTEQSRL